MNGLCRSVEGKDVEIIDSGDIVEASLGACQAKRLVNLTSN